MGNSTNVLQEQDDFQAVDQTSKTSTEISNTYSQRDLLDAYEMEFWYEEQLWKLN